MKALRLLYRMYIVLRPQYGWNVFAILYNMVRFTGEYIRYTNAPHNPAFSVSVYEWYPCLTDKTASTPLDPVYFYQDAWAAGKIFRNRPAHHYDVGSSAKTVGIISQFVPTTMVDIRPVELRLEGLSFTEGSILALPFADGTIESISSICVVEHIGLGRYGDPIDPFGSEKAVRELVRVTRPGGFIYFTVPVESANRVYFNGYRSFTRDTIIGLFDGCTLIEERYIYGKELVERHRPESDAGIGLFMFTKR